jgi:hypothetical protein
MLPHIFLAKKGTSHSLILQTIESQLPNVMQLHNADPVGGVKNR